MIPVSRYVRICRPMRESGPQSQVSQRGFDRGLRMRARPSPGHLPRLRTRFLPSAIDRPLRLGNRRILRHTGPIVEDRAIVSAPGDSGPCNSVRIAGRFGAPRSLGPSRNADRGFRRLRQQSRGEPVLKPENNLRNGEKIDATGLFGHWGGRRHRRQRGPPVRPGGLSRRASAGARIRMVSTGWSAQSRTMATPLPDSC